MPTRKVGVYLKDEWIAPKAVAFINDYLENFATKAYARNVRGKTAKDSLTLVDDLIVKGKRRADVKNAVTATLLAGKDPTTTSLAWAYYEIARHPYVFEKMKEEVKEQYVSFPRSMNTADNVLLVSDSRDYLRCLIFTN